MVWARLCMLGGGGGGLGAETLPRALKLQRWAEIFLIHE
jgi:hypothetical protein